MAARRLLEVIWRRKLIVVVAAALVIGAASWSLSTQAVRYDSRAKIALLPEADTPELVPFYGQAVESLLPTYAQIVESRTFLEGVVRDLPFETTPGALGAAVRAVPVARVGVLDIVGSSRSPERAQQAAQATAEALVERLEGNGIITITLLDDARIPTEPAAPKPRLVYAVAIVLGLLFGALAAVGWDRYFGRVNSVADLQEFESAGVLAVLPEVRRLNGRRVVVGDPALAELEESLRTLRTNVFFAASNIGRGTTVVTGLSPGDGKSTVVANLAVMTAELGLSVILIDGDLHRPVQHEIFGLPNDIGLSSVSPTTPVDAVCLPTRYPNLRVVPSGPPITSRAEELRVYLETLPKFRPLAEVILVDSPPIRAADEVRILAAFSAQVVLLVRSGSVSARQLRQAIEGLRMVGATLLGVVLSRSKSGEGTESFDYYRNYRRPGDHDGSDAIGSGSGASPAGDPRAEPSS